MTRLALALAAAGCTCPPCEEPDRTETGDTATTNIVGSIDLATPSGDADYDLYTAAIAGLDRLTISQGGVYQIDMGIAGVFAPDPSGEQDAGSVYVERIGPAEDKHFREHWFLLEDDDTYAGVGNFTLEYEATGNWGDALQRIEGLDAQWQDHTYLCMDIQYKDSPQDLDALDYEGEFVDGFEFDVMQDLGGGLTKTASLLRELHHHPQLGDLYVDFWSFSPNFDFLDAPGDRLEATLVTRLAPPPSQWYAPQGDGMFARFYYYVEEGEDYPCI